MGIKEARTIGHPRYEKGYKLLNKITFDEVTDFILQQIIQRNIFTIIYFTGLLFLFGFCFLFPLVLPDHLTEKKDILISLFYGLILIPVISIPIHEFIHGLALLLVGAPSVKAGLSMKNFFFYVTADKYLLTVHQFLVVSLSPALLITLILASMVFISDAGYNFRFGCVIAGFIHFSMCIGDFALMGYLWQHRKRHIVTCDDISGKAMCFYIPETDARNP